MSEGYDFATFGLSDMVRAAATIRKSAERAPNFSEAADSIVDQLWTGFVDEQGQPVLRLVRLMSTRRLADLTGQPRRVALDRLGGLPPDPDIRCLTLLATRGAEPAWHGSAPADHHVIPLPSVDVVTTEPMISALLQELGLPADDVVAGKASARHGPCGVFHVLDAVGSPHIPHQRFVVEHGVSSVLGIGGVLTGGEVFCAVMFSRVPIPFVTAERFRAVAVGARAGLLAHQADSHHETDLVARSDALREYLTVLEDASHDQATELEEAVDRLRAEADLVDTLRVVGQRLTAQLDLDTLVQDATDAATKVTGAAFGAFFYNVTDSYGESYMLYTLAGVPKETFASFPMPRNTAMFGVTFIGTATVRSPDVRLDPRYGQNAPYYGMPPGHLPVCSYLAVPVISPSTRAVLGGFFFGHPEPGRFTQRHEHLAEGVAGYTAIALDNARLFARQHTMATELAHSMLPTVPPIPDLAIVSRYLPAATGSEVGGDWFDVIELPAGRTAFVIGDVVGRGVTAAAVMGQIRTAVRSYALLDLPPADVLRHVSELAGTTPGANFITCLYAVYDSAERTLSFANAGHMPAVLLRPDGSATLIAEALGMPLGVGERFAQQRILFPPGHRLVLYTDGLVEAGVHDLDTGIAALIRSLRDIPGDADAQSACDEIIAELTGGRHDDDIALLYVHNVAAPNRSSPVPRGTDARPTGPAPSRPAADGSPASPVRRGH